MKKVLVLVLSFEKEPWRSIETLGQRATWAAKPITDVPVYFYYGVISGPRYWAYSTISKGLHMMGQPRLRRAFLRFIGPRHTFRARQSGDRIDVDVPDFYGNLGAKTVAAFRHVLKEHPFDYLYRTNTSSYTYLPLLRQYVQSLPATRYYGGPIDIKPDVSVINGAGLLMSRDMVELTAYDPSFDWDLMEDAAIAHSLARAGVRPQSLPRILLTSTVAVQSVLPDQWRNCFNVRCKTEGNRFDDINTMKAVHAAYLRTWGS